MEILQTIATLLFIFLWLLRGPTRQTLISKYNKTRPTFDIHLLCCDLDAKRFKSTIHLEHARTNAVQTCMHTQQSLSTLHSGVVSLRRMQIQSVPSYMHGLLPLSGLYNSIRRHEMIVPRFACSTLAMIRSGSNRRPWSVTSPTCSNASIYVTDGSYHILSCRAQRGQPIPT